MRKCYMRYDSIAEECRCTSPGAIEELVRYHDVRGRVSFLHRPHGRSGNDSFDSECFESVDSCSKRQLGWHEPVSASVTCKTSYASTFETANDKLVRWRAKRCRNVDFLDVLEDSHLVEAAAAY